VLESSDLVAFVATTDAGRARGFYEAVLGLPLVSQGPIACVFQAHRVQIRVTVVERVVPAPYTVLGWVVANLASTMGELAERGVEFIRYDSMGQDELGAWRSPSGARVAWFKDPDGNILSVTQP
jgi:predicted enzyme related to lactoylglutathione lyase